MKALGYYGLDFGAVAQGWIMDVPGHPKYPK